MSKFLLRPRPSLLNALWAFLAGSVLLFAGACGAASETVTVPSQTRCGVQAQAERVAFSPDGGSGTVRITTNRECTWAAESGAAWVTLSSPLTGQGDGSVQFSVAANADPASRGGTISVADQRLQISQEGRKCEYRLSSSAESVDMAGGERTIEVNTGSAQCRWTAAAEVPWITILSGREGAGTGAVTFRVDPISGPQRDGTVTVAGQSVRIQQGAGCSYSIATPTVSVGSAGGPGDIPVSAPAGCAWTAQSETPWIAISSGSSGTGAGVVSFRVAATDGPARTGTLTVAGRLVTVTQTPGCSYAVEPLTYAAPAQGGAAAIAVRTGTGCGWTASSASAWIGITAGSPGNGPGELRVSIAPNASEARTATLQVGDQAVTITQASGCTVTLSPSSVSVGAALATGTIQVAAAEGCRWTAAAAAPWITVASGSAGSGAGQVQYSIAANPGPARESSLSIAGRTVPITQASGCTVTLSPSSVSVGAAPAAGAIQVATPEGCPWTAATATSWITIAAGSAGSGAGQVQYSVAANAGPAREGSLTIAGRTVPLTQASGCTYSAAPASQDIPGSGGGGAASVTTAAGCPWTASSSVPWISVGATSGTGPAQVPFTVAVNDAPPRTGTLTVAGQPLTVTQASTCTWTFAPPSHVLGADGGNGNVLVVVNGACTWTAVSNDGWITLTTGASGTGSGLLQFVAAPNNGPARTGSLTIAGQRYEVTEAAR